MQDKILVFLRRRGGYVSGEELSERLGLTRAGVWKHIEFLRKEGYKIEAVPHLGYKLVSIPDRLFPEEISWCLHTKFIGRKIFCYEDVDSTMDIAYELGLKNFPEGTLVCSESQRKGRGRLGRKWVSPPFKGIYFSLILRPEIFSYEASKLTILSAVAVREAIGEFTDLECLIKWPNDLLINDRKVGGILTETQTEVDRVRFVIIGIGINVNTERKILPSKATSLKEEKGERIQRIELMKEILRKLEKYYLIFKKEGFVPIVEEWKKYSTILGERIRIISHHKSIEGEALDLDKDGTLLVRRDSGFIEKVLAGDVVKIC